MKTSVKLLAAFVFCSSTALVGWVSVQRVMASLPVQTCGALTMHLQPGVVKYPGSPFPSPKPPADMPLAPLAVLAPVFTGAAPTAVNSSDAEPSYIDNSYSETTVAGYSTKASVHQVIAWYNSTVPSCGYSLQDDGWGGNVHAPTYYVIDCQGINLPNLNLAITLQKTKSGVTEIWYFAQVISEPGRPKSSYIRFSATSVKITYVFSGGNRAWHVDIPSRRVTGFRQTDPVGNLEGVIDASQTLSQGCGTGEGGPDSGATLTFIAKSGQKRTVTVGPQCQGAFRVGNSRPIADEFGVWTTVQLTVYRYCMGHKCTKTTVKS